MGERKSSIFKRWFRPLLLVSLGLHGFFLVLPLSGPATTQQDEPIPENPLEDPLPATIDVAPLPVLESAEVMPSSAAVSQPAPPAQQPKAASVITDTEILEAPLAVQPEPENDEAPPVEPSPEPLADPPVEPSTDPPVAPVSPYSDSGTSNDDARKVYTDWFQRTYSRYSVMPDANQPPLVVIPLSSQCRNPVPEPASVGIVASADGTVMEDPTLFKSSGYQDLNEQLLEQAKNRLYPTEGSIRTFRIDVEIQYEDGVCTANNAGESSDGGGGQS